MIIIRESRLLPKLLSKFSKNSSETKSKIFKARLISSGRV